MSSNQLSNSKTNDNINSFRFVKALVERKDFGYDSSIRNLIKYVKKSQIRDWYKIIINLINMNVEDSSNVQYQKLQLEDSILNSKCNVNHITRDFQIIWTISQNKNIIHRICLWNWVNCNKYSKVSHSILFCFNFICTIYMLYFFVFVWF